MDHEDLLRAYIVHTHADQRLLGEIFKKHYLTEKPPKIVQMKFTQERSKYESSNDKIYIHNDVVLNCLISYNDTLPWFEMPGMPDAITLFMAKHGLDLDGNDMQIKPYKCCHCDKKYRFEKFLIVHNKRPCLRPSY